MHLVCINCTPRAVGKSNTAKILDAFITGYEGGNHTAEIHHLSLRQTWPQIREAFYQHERILFALPLFVEAVPGIMLEFLETLETKDTPDGQPKTRIAFLLQSGFPEASQLRCGERYLKMLPAYMGCEHAGTLIKGNMFAVSLLEGKSRASMVDPFIEMGASFAEHERFTEEIAAKFAGPEHFSKGMQRLITLATPMQRLMFRSMAKKLGCKQPLNAQPYAKYVE